VRPRGGNAFDWLLAFAALTAGSVIALRAPGLGDYPYDAGPALSAIAHGAIGSFFSHQPAMGAVSLYLRAPFVALAAALHDSALGMYRLGDLPCVLSVAIVAAWMAHIAGRRGTGRAGQALIVAICLFNPLVSNTLTLGHPEELLTTSLAVGSLLAACERRVVLTAVLAGLAVASKQWALLAVCPTLLVLERDRIRAAVLMLAVAAASTLPMIAGNFAAFRHALNYISTPQPITTLFNWLYPLSSTRAVRTSLIFGRPSVFIWHADSGIVMALSHPTVIVIGFAIPLLMWYRRGRQLSGTEMVVAAAIVFLLRCVLDPGSQPYYHLPLVFTLVALDATAGRKLPLAGLAGATGAFVFLDRVPAYLPPGSANLLYVAASVAAVALLLRELRPGAAAASGRPRRWRATGVRRHPA
jgi:Glycosyltransferase family 87